MGQTKNAPRTADNEARAFVKYVRTSPQKLNLVAQMIRGKKAEKAVSIWNSNRRVSNDVKNVWKAPLPMRKTTTIWISIN